MPDVNQQVQELLGRIPEPQRQAASALIAQYGPRLFDLAAGDAMACARRLLAGDLDVVAELDARLSDDAWLARVKANTARWENVAQYNKVRADMRNEFLLRAAPIVLSVLLALVGL